MAEGDGSNISKNTIIDHDLLTRIDENVKTIKENHSRHLSECASNCGMFNEKFAKINENREKDLSMINKRFLPLEQDRWKIVGAMAIILVFLKFIPSPWK